FSPVLGYIADQDLVFVGDVNAKFKPWLVPTQRLYDAQNTIDSDSGLKRGVLEIEAR
ncbi:MAG TPA: phytochelatin synthase family protein, partial [Roseiarcus sp.]|nr:phytochelatin synthase family protein [Roseiarcus sp.]